MTRKWPFYSLSTNCLTENYIQVLAPFKHGCCFPLRMREREGRSISHIFNNNLYKTTNTATYDHNCDQGIVFVSIQISKRSFKNMAIVLANT